ncbi:MAG TPA: isoleucine--tRNA ligase [Chthoniobacterales bacterium]
MNYKDTLNLPKTDFAMKAGLTTREPAMLADWEKNGLYQQIQSARKDAPLFVLHDGPPFANGDVHMGTAMNKILKDFIVKSKTMAGFRAPYVPGWDCHGLPIEFKVVKESRGLSPAEIRKKSEAYARKFIDIQRNQFKRLGVLGDWENPYLTLDPEYEADIIRSFAVFVEKGLVYQSKKPVYWSTGAQTALAEAEVEYAERTDPAIFVTFPLVTGPLAGKADMVIWTTTPWTLPANVAIAVHPKQEYVVGRFDQRAFVIARPLLGAFQQETGLTMQEEFASLTGQELAGNLAQHPFLDRKSLVITGDYVTMDTGTGQVHTAPGHGADDYISGIANKLPILSPVDDNGRLTAEAGVPALTGKYVFDANADIVALLKESGSLLAEQKYVHSYPHCWRSKTPIVFRAVEQFFIRLDDIRKDALKAIDSVQWIPAWGRNRIAGTVEARPDWCISRQRTWGVPLPVFYTAGGQAILDAATARKVADLIEKNGTNLWFEKTDAEWAALVGLPEGTTRRNDTLDVWIDSGTSHQAVLKRRPELHFPADVYIEGTDQHRGWFQSSLLTSVAIEGVAPYKAVATNGFVVDTDGKKISKSSDYQKPMDAKHYVEKYGADIVRLWVSSTNYPDEVPFGEEMFTRLADTYRRIRNTLRILLANLYDFDPATDAVPDAELTFIDRWALSRLGAAVRASREGYDSYEFLRVYHSINQFCAVDLSSLYVDITKDRMYCDAPDSPRRRSTQTVMHRIFDALTRLLAPVLAFTADEAWAASGKKTSVHLELFPSPDDYPVNPEVEAEAEKLMSLRSGVAQGIEARRQEKLIGNALEARVIVSVPDSEKPDLDLSEIEEFLILSDLQINSGITVEKGGELMSWKGELLVAKTDYPRCERCWRHRPTVGLSPAHPHLCDRCAAVVK